MSSARRAARVPGAPSVPCDPETADPMHVEAALRAVRHPRLEFALEVGLHLEEFESSSTPMTPSTFRHAGQCEHRYTSDPALLRAILKVRDGAGGGYWWVECGTCECGWQVPHYAVA